MAQRLNKKLVVSLTITGMVITTGAAVVMLRSVLPKRDPAPMVEQAERARTAGDYATASRWYERAYVRARSAEGGLGQANEYLIEAGELALAAGDARQAVKLWQKVVTDDSTNERAQQNIVDYLLEAVSLRQALWGDVQQEAEKLQQMNPKNPAALHALGLAKTNQREIRPENLKEGESLLVEAFDADKVHPRYAESLALHYDRENQQDKAVQVLDEMIANLPDDPKVQEEAWRRRGRFFLIKRNVQQQDLRQREATRKGLADLPALREEIAKSDAEALRCLEEASRLGPENVENLLSVADYWAMKLPMATDEAQRKAQGEEFFSKAEERYRQVIELDPDGYEAYLRLARLQADQRRQDYEKAYKVLEARRARGIQRTGYLGARNKWLMAAVRSEMYRYGMLQAELSRMQGEQTAALREEITARLENLYNEQVADSGEEDANVLFMLGRLLILKGEIYDAIKAMERAERLVTEPVPEIKQYLAQLYIQTGEIGPAQEALQVVLRAYPNNATGWANLAVLYGQTGQFEQSLQASTRALELDPDNRVALITQVQVYKEQKNWDKVEELQKRLGSEQDSIADKLQRATIYRLRAGEGEERDIRQLQEAERLLREVLDADPLNLVALRHLGIVLSEIPGRSEELTTVITDRRALAEQRLNDLATTAAPAEKEKEQYRQIIATLDRLSVLADPDASEADKLHRMEELIRRGEDPFVQAIELFRLYAQLPDREPDAIAQLREAYRLKPDEPGVIEAMFVTALRIKDWATAEELVRKATDMGLDRAGGSFYRGRLMMARADQANHLQEAVRLFREGLAEFPTYSQGHAWLGRALAELKQLDEAARAFEEALRLNQNNPLAAVALASLAAQRGDAEGKARYLSLCAKLAPNHPWVRAELQSEEDARDPKKGIVRREALRKTDPQDLSNLLRLADLYERVGNYEAAGSIYEECRRLAPQELRVVQHYAAMLRTKQPPEPEVATRMLTDLVTQIGTDGKPEPGPRQAAVQLLLASHLAELLRAEGPNAPTLEDVDKAYTAAAGFAENSMICRDIAVHFLSTNRFDQAEEWARKAMAHARTAQALEEERLAHRVVVDAMLQMRDVTRDEEMKKELEAYRTRFDDAFALLAQSDYHAGAGRLSQALEYITQYISRQPNEALGYLKRGDIYYRRSLWQDAMVDYRRVRSLQPKGFEYQHRLRLARCQEYRGADDLAIAELLSILEDDENQWSAVQELLRLYTKLKRFKPAEDLLLARLSKNPENAMLAGLLARLHLATGNWDQAYRYGVAAVRYSGFNDGMIDNLFQACLQYQKYDDLIRLVNETLPTEKRKEPYVVNRLAAAYAGRGGRSQALELYNQALDATLASMDHYASVVQGMRDQLGEEAAREVLEQRLAARPEERPARFALATLRREQDGGEAFVTTIRGLLDGVPADTPDAQQQRLFLMRALAVTLYQLKKHDESRKVYEEMLEVNPNHVIALNNLAYMLMDQLDDPKAALPYAQRASRLLPRDANVLDTLGWNLILLGRYDDGIAILRQAAGIDDSIPAIHYHVAEGFYRRGNTSPPTRDEDHREASTECRRAFELLKTIGRDDAGVHDDLIALGDKLGLALEDAPVAAPSDQSN